MLIVSTKKFKVAKLREWVNFLAFCHDDDNVAMTVDETDGKLTIQLSVNHEHSCMSLIPIDHEVVD
jgi:hypothetical protein